MKKIIAMLLMAILVLAGCSGDTSSAESDGVLKIFGWAGQTSTPEDEVLFEEWASEQIGMPVECSVPTDDYEKQLSAALSSGESYDLIYLQQTEYMKLVEQGALMDLSGYIEGSDVLSNPEIVNPDIYYAPLTLQDGSIYALPTKYEGGMVSIVRQDWLDEWGMAAPTTLEEWEAYWEMCKTEKGAYGISIRGIDYIQPWMSGFGLQEGVQLQEDGTYTVSYASDEAAAAWNWWADMYAKGYLEPNFETNSSSDFRNAFMAGTVGSVGYWYHWVYTFEKKIAEEEQTENNKTFDAVATEAVPGPDGTQTLSYGDLSLLAVPANATDPDKAIELMEVLYSEAGNIMSVYGFEGVDYTVEADGTITQTEKGAAEYGTTTPVTGTWETPEEFQDEDKDQAQTYVDETGVAVLKPANWDDVNDVIAKYASQCIKGQITGEEAVAAMQEEIIALSTETVTYSF